MVDKEPKILGDCSNRTLKKIGEIDPRSFESDTVNEIEIESWKRKRSEKWYVYLDKNTGHLRKSKARY